MKIIFTVILAALLMSALPGYGLVVAVAQQKSQTTKTVRYACPMHPEVTSARRGRCRKCGMALRLKKADVDLTAAPAPGVGDTVSASPEPEANPISFGKIPDVIVADQNGRRLRFYSDLVAGKVVAINFIFTTCTASCPLLAATFRRLQEELGGRVGRNVWLISISVDPSTDTPERLRNFATKFKAGPGWTFVTGDKNDIDAVLREFGVAVANKNDHTPMILIGNDGAGYWTRAYGLSAPSALAKLVMKAANRK